MEMLARVATWVLETPSLFALELEECCCCCNAAAVVLPAAVLHCCASAASVVVVVGACAPVWETCFASGVLAPDVPASPTCLVEDAVVRPLSELLEPHHLRPYPSEGNKCTMGSIQLWTWWPCFLLMCLVVWVGMGDG